MRGNLLSSTKKTICDAKQVRSKFTIYTQLLTRCLPHPIIHPSWNMEHFAILCGLQILVAKIYPYPYLDFFRDNFGETTDAYPKVIV